MDRRPPTRVVEEPKRSIVPFLAVAIVAAVVIWTVEQDRLQGLTADDEQTGKLTTITEVVPTQRKGDLRTVFSADDYPFEAQMRGEEGTVQAALAVDATGRVTGCTIVRSSNYASLDQATCAILQRRARFTPARDRTGNAVPDRVVSPPITWRLAG